MGVWSPQQQTFPEGPGCWPRLSMSDIRKTGALHDLWAATRLEGSLHVRHHIGGAQPRFLHGGQVGWGPLLPRHILQGGRALHKSRWGFFI